MALLTNSGQRAYLTGNVLAISWKSYKVPSIVLCLAKLKPGFYCKTFPVLFFLFLDVFLFIWPGVEQQTFAH